MKPVEPKSEVTTGTKDIPMPKVRKLRRHMNSLDIHRAGTTGWLNFRDRVMIELMLQTGLRREEVAWINIEDVQDRDIMPVIGKGRKKRHVPLRQDLRHILAAFLKAKRKRGESLDDGAPLFVSRKGNRLSLRQINLIVAGRCEDAGIGHFTPHALRHTFSRWFLQMSENINQAVGNLSTILGHSDIRTTYIYLKDNLADIAASMDRMALN
jgi:integrase/recombinase XerC